MQAGAAASTKVLFRWLQSLTIKNFAASGMKRAAVVTTEHVLIRLLVPSALSSSVIYLATSTAGSMGKNLVSYSFSRESGTHNEMLLIVPKDEVEAIQKRLAQESKWNWSISAIGSSLKSSVKSKAIGACTHVLNISYQDLSQGSGAFIGSTAATACVLYFMGPPTLLALPLYFLVEGTAKSLGAFIGRYAGRYYIGPMAIRPVFRSFWEALKSDDPKALQFAQEAIIEITLIDFNEYSGELLARHDSVSDLSEMLADWQLMEVKPPPDPTVKLLEAPEASDATDDPQPKPLLLNFVEIQEDYIPAVKQADASTETQQNCATTTSQSPRLTRR